MTVTIIARLADQLGHASRVDLTPRSDGCGVEVRHRSWAVPPAAFRWTQPATIKVNIDHDPGHAVGAVVALERRHGELWMVARCDHDELAHLPHPVYASVETDSRMDGSDAVLTGVGLVYRSAAVNAQPVTFVAGDLPVAAMHTTGDLREHLARALEYRQGHRPSAPHQITDPHPAAALAEVRNTRGQPATPLEHGAGGQVLAVR